MDERDWFTATDPLAMLDYLFPVRGMDSIEPQTRSSRLYLLGCARRAWDQLPGVCRAVVTVAERLYFQRTADTRLREAVYPLAEGLIHIRGESSELNNIGWALVALGHATADEVLRKDDIDPEVWTGFAHLTFFPFSRTTPHFRRIPAHLHSADLAREVFGNPLARPPEFDQSWRSDNVIKLAQHAHASGDFSVLPVLADALQEAGCDRDDILDHFRDPRATHIRGCWALELVLG
jgi:hypothetical protein